MRSFCEDPEPPFVIGTGPTDAFADPRRWARRFADERAIVCRDVFDAALFDRLVAESRKTTFCDDHVAGLGTRQVEAPQRVGGILRLMLQRPGLLRWLEQVTGHTSLAGADGRLVQTRVGGDALVWHDDLEEERRVLGITIGFTELPYAGGRFELRRVGEPGSLRTFDHTRAGTALIFDLGTDIEHRLLPLSGGGPRRVFTGWFLRDSPLSAALA